MDDRELAAYYKERYCRGDKRECARYRVASTLGREAVPGDLYPNMLTRAKKIVNGAGNGLPEEDGGEHRSDIRKARGAQGRADG
ncbi:MAG: hypothetical protein K9L28_07530 [Synergistales bacterium]|nr:hypothetical protein [Synergistales bacterium]